MSRLALEARDNARLLATLERHFRALEEGALAGVAGALPPMLSALRMVRTTARCVRGGRAGGCSKGRHGGRAACTATHPPTRPPALPSTHPTLPTHLQTLRSG